MDDRIFKQMTFCSRALASGLLKIYFLRGNGSGAAEIPTFNREIVGLQGRNGARSSMLLTNRRISLTTHPMANDYKASIHWSTGTCWAKRRPDGILRRLNMREPSPNKSVHYPMKKASPVIGLLTAY